MQSIEQQHQIGRVITKLLDDHDSEWFQQDDGTIVMLEHLRRYEPDPADPLHGTVHWLTELTPVHTIKETLVHLGY